MMALRPAARLLLIVILWLIGILPCPASAIVGSEHLQYDVDLLQAPWTPDKAAPGSTRDLDAAPAWSTWLRQYPGWQVRWNAVSRSVHRAWGPGVRTSRPPTPSSIETLCRDLLGQTAPWSGIDASSLRLVQARFRLQRWYVVFEQTHEAVPVFGGRVDLRLDADGRLMLLGADWIGASPSSRTRSLTAAEVLRAAQVGFDRPTQTAATRRTVFAAVPGPGGTTLRLAEEVTFRTASPVGVWRCLVDLQDGRLLRRHNELRTVDVVGSISAQVEPNTPFDAPQLEPLQDTRLDIDEGMTEFAFTDDQGDVVVPTAAVDSVDVFLGLAGSVAQVYNFELGGITPRIDSRMLPGAPRAFVWDDSNSRASERDAYKHTLVAHDWINAMDPLFTGVDYIMPVVVDIGGRECNAWWDGLGINFLQAGPQCVNTARIADVVYHEYGHGITDLQYRPFAPSGAMHEAFSDYMAATMRNDPEIGNGFYGPGTRIRTIDNTLRTPEDLTGEVHHDGLILAGALWDMRSLLGATLADTLFHFARYGLATNFDDYLLDVLVTDDDNGNIYDGTPNMDWIVLAFEAHGIGDYDVSIRHDGLPDTEDTAKELDVESTILSLFPLDPTTLNLHYRIDEGAWTSLPLSDAGGIRAFTATLPSQASGTTVDYWLEAGDTRGHSSRWPGPDPQDVHRFVIGPDTMPPTIAAANLPDRPLDAPGWRVLAQVHDNLDRGLASVDLVWSRGDVTLDQTLPLQPGQDGWWEGSIPPGGALLGDIVSYAFVATDSATSPNTTRLPPTGAESFRVVQGLLRDFEADDGGMSATGDWQWGVPTLAPASAWSGQKLWATSLDGGYSNGTQASLTLPAVDLGTWQSAALSFRHWYGIEDYWDGGRVEISADGGTTWHLLVPDGGYPWEFVDVLGGPGYSGDSSGWQSAAFDLSSYRGRNVLLRLRFASDGSVTDVGWSVDDIEVVERQILAVPLHLRATDGVDQQVPLAWDPPAGIDPQLPGSPLLGYDVLRGTQPDLSDATQVNAAPVVQESFVDDTVVNGTLVHYAVRAVYATGASPPSGIVAALPYRAVYAASTQEVVVEAEAGAGADTSVTFSNAGTGFLKLNAWIGDAGQSVDDVRITWTLAGGPLQTSAGSGLAVVKAGAVPRAGAAARLQSSTRVPDYTVVFEDPLDSSGSVDLHRFAVAQENGILYFRVTGHSNWQNILTDWTLVISIDSDADRGTGDPAGADHYVLVGAFPMQVVGVPAFVSNTSEEILGIASHVVVPLNSDSLEVGFDSELLGATASHVFLSAAAFPPDLSMAFDMLPNTPSAAAWLTLGQQSLSIQPATPQALPLELAAGLTPAAYDALLFLDTNDPDAASVALPLQFRSGVTPVTLHDLHAVQERQTVSLTWRTSTESAVRAYRVFRSRNGDPFVARTPDVPLEPQRRYGFRDTPVAPGHYAYRIGEVAASGEVTLHGLVELDVVQAVPADAFLDPGAPNPFNPSTRLSFGVDVAGPASLRIFDVRGRLVRTLLQEPRLAAGYHERLWDGRDDHGRRVASGVYHVRLVANGRGWTRRLTLLK